MPGLPIDLEYLRLIFTPQDVDSYPEKRLFAAILERAIADALCATGRCVDSQRHAREAFAWLTRLPTKTIEPHTFRWVCEGLDLDPDALRMTIIRWKAKNKKFYRGKERARNKTLAA